MESPAPVSELGSATSPSDPPPPPPPPGKPPSSILKTIAVVGTVVVIVVVIVSVVLYFPASVWVGVVIVTVIVLVGVSFYYIKKKRKLALRNLPSFAPKNDLSIGPPESRQQNVPPPTANNGPVSTEDTASPRIAANSSVPPLSRHNTIRDLTSIFTYEELKMATDNFSDANFLGQGGFGTVHKGFLPNGTVVAIKQLQTGSKQGEREFKTEVDTISRVHHRHLVSLVGYCMSEEHRLLVYEFVPNKTLQFHLHEQGRPVMSWRNRMKIALGSARGLTYLHEYCRPRIIHRDIKAANILIDESFEAKVADFGLAKSFLDTETHVSTRIMGTPGYIAPEYECFGRLTEKSDIFSFGVMLLELITGRPPILENKMLVHWARPLLSQALKDDNFIAFVDPNLEYDNSEMKRIVACAAACVRISDKDRPPMIQIALALEGIIPLENLDEGVIPGQRRADSYRNSQYGSSQFKDDMKNIFNNLVRESGEHGSRSFITAGDQTLSGPSTKTVKPSNDSRNVKI